VKKILALLLSLMFFAVACNQTNSPAEQVEHTLQVGKAIVTVEVADTVDSRRIGLSNREYLKPDSGMLFVFTDKSNHGFWMKDTLIPLDFVWIADGLVVDITENVPVEIGRPDAELTRYMPSKLVDSMLEVNAGWIARKGVKIGDTAEFLGPGARP